MPPHMKKQQKKTPVWLTVPLEATGSNRSKSEQRRVVCEKLHPLSAPVRTAEPEFNEQLKRQTQFKSSDCQHQQRSELAAFFCFDSGFSNGRNSIVKLYTNKNCENSLASVFD